MIHPGPLRAAFAAALASLVAAAARAGPAWGAETSGDVETDHLDAADDGGPRTWGLAVRPLEADLGLVGVELRAALGSRTVLGIETSWLAVAPDQAYGATLGVAIFPTRFAFHGFYVNPRVEGWRAVGASALGAGALAGYEWTAPVGATLRLGGGLAAATWAGRAPTTPPLRLTGILPELDAAVGWVF